VLSSDCRAPEDEDPNLVLASVAEYVVLGVRSRGGGWSGVGVREEKARQGRGKPGSDDVVPEGLSLTTSWLYKLLSGSSGVRTVPEAADRQLRGKEKMNLPLPALAPARASEACRLRKLDTKTRGQ
jgi:hypothetical protein